MINIAKERIMESRNLLDSILKDDNFFISIEKSIQLISSSLKNGGKVISCGNGGSMSDAMHFAEELTGRFIKNRPALPAISISDPSHISCVANDYGYEYIFSKYIEAHGNKNDILLAISTSGNSQNVINAVNIAKEKGMQSISLLGKDGGKLKNLSNQSLIVDNMFTSKIQEVHIKIIHILIEGIEREIFPDLY